MLSFPGLLVLHIPPGAGPTQLVNSKEGAWMKLTGHQQETTCLPLFVLSGFPASDGCKTVYKLLFFGVMLALGNGVLSNTLQSSGFLLGS